MPGRAVLGRSAAPSMRAWGAATRAVSTPPSATPDRAAPAASAKRRARSTVAVTPGPERTRARALSSSAPSRGRRADRPARRPPSAGGQGADDGQRVDALDQVVAGGLAQLLVGGDQVEDVVDDLEDHAERVAVLGERLDVRHAAGPATMPPMRQAAANSDAVLPVDRARGRRPRCGRRRRSCAARATWPSHRRPIVRGQQPGHLDAERGGDLRRPGQQEVAGEDGAQVAPAGVDAGSTPRRVTASSMTSSWYSEPRWTSSTDDAAHGPRRRVAGVRRRPGAAATARTGRSRLPPATMRWLAMSVEERVVGVDGGPQRRLDAGQVGRQRRAGPAAGTPVATARR